MYIIKDQDIWLYALVMPASAPYYSALKDTENANNLIPGKGTQ